MRFTIRMLFAGCVAFSCAANSANAATIFMANLTGDQEVGPVVTDAVGTGTFILNDDQTELSYSIEIFGLDLGNIRTPEDDDNLTRAHLHNAPAGVNGPVRFGILDPQHDMDDRVISVNDGDMGSIVLQGVWGAEDEANGAAALPGEVPELLAGNFYINIHTPGNPGVEIRGQLFVVPEPAAVALASLAILGIATFRRRG